MLELGKLSFCSSAVVDISVTSAYVDALSKVTGGAPLLTVLGDGVFAVENNIAGI